MFVVGVLVLASLLGVLAMRPWKQEHTESKSAVRTAETKAGYSGEESPDAAIQSGDPEILFLEAQKYFFGDGRKRNLVTGAQLLSKAAEKGHTKAQLNLGYAYLQGSGVGKDAVAGVAWLRKAAEANLPEAQYELGRILSNGIGVPKDQTEAVSWYLKAAGHGERRAFVNLGYCYGEGLGVPRNNSEAAYWYRQGAEMGEFAGMLAMASYLQLGASIPQDLTEAYKWSLLARAVGSTNGELSIKNSDSQRNKNQLEKTFQQLRTLMSREQIDDAKQRADKFVPSETLFAPRLEQNASLSLKEPSGLARVTIERVLIGQRAVDNQLVHQFQLEEERKRGRELVYFQITVKNLHRDQDLTVSQSGFTLRDEAGNSYPAQLTTDFLNGRAFPGDTVRGGVGFAVQQGNVLSQLIYDTGWVNLPPLDNMPRTRVLAQTTALGDLEIFKRPLQKR